MPGKHTPKQKRQAEHVADSERRRGESSEEAERIGWATVNARKSFQVHGLFASGKPGEHVYPTERRALGAAKKLDAHLPKPGTSEHEFHTKMGWSGGNHAVKRVAESNKSLEWGRDVSGKAAKGFQLTSIVAEYAKACCGKTDDVMEKTRPKKFPRDGSPAAMMKPVSDEDAMASARKDAKKKGGKKTKKSMRWLAALKALATGYSKVSGGGALKAANRGMPLLGPDGKPGRANNRNRTRFSVKPRGGSKAKVRKALVVAPGADVVAATSSGVEYHLGDHHDRGLTKGNTVATTNFNDLFKSELGDAADSTLVDCPHCESPITKSDLAKARSKKEKRGKSSAHVSEQFPEGGAMRGGDGRGVHPPTRSVPGVSKVDPAVGVQNSKGSNAKKSEAVEEESAEGVEAPAPAAPAVVKKSITIRGTEYVRYVDDGSDAALAKAISEGSLGGTSPTRPLDLNNDLTRLLI